MIRAAMVLLTIAGGPQTYVWTMFRTGAPGKIWCSNGASIYPTGPSHSGCRRDTSRVTCKFSSEASLSTSSANNSSDGDSAA
jgi:hypothetical protein